MSLRKALREAQEQARNNRCCLVYWEGEDSVTVLTSVKVTMETEDVGVSCSVREGSVTHTNGRLAAFGPRQELNKLQKRFEAGDWRPSFCSEAADDEIHVHVDDTCAAATTSLPVTTMEESNTKGKQRKRVRGKENVGPAKKRGKENVGAAKKRKTVAVTKTAGKILTVELPPPYLESENAPLTTCEPTIIPDITSVAQSQTSSNKNAPLTTCEPTVIPDVTPVVQSQTSSNKNAPLTTCKPTVIPDVTPVVQSQTSSNNDAPLTTSESADAPDVTPVAQSQTSNNDVPLTTSESADVPDITPAIPPRAPTPLFSPEASLSPRGTDCFDPTDLHCFLIPLIVYPWTWKFKNSDTRWMSCNLANTRETARLSLCC